MAKAKAKKPAARPARAKAGAPKGKELTDEDLEQVAGGNKHIAGVKYEDISVNVGAGMSKN